MYQSRVVRIVNIFVCAVCLCTLAFARDQKSPTKLSDLPAEAQWRVSAALGSDMPEYHVRATRDGYDVKNPAQKLNALFGLRGLEVQTESTRFAMSVQGYGYGAVLVPVRHVRPNATSNRVEYRHGPFTEWYVNGPMGLEQGFTIREQPGTNHNRRPLTITIALAGNLYAVADENEGGLRLNRSAGDAVLRYTGLIAQDADGKRLQASLTVQSRTGLLLEVDDSFARYPVTIDPAIQNFTLTASDGENGNDFGYSVAFDGNTAVVGAPFTSDGGEAYVFVMPGGSWKNMTQTAILTASDGAAGNEFGTAVGISGNTVVVGAIVAAVNGNPGVGAAYVFVKPSQGWKNMTETAKLVASDGEFLSYFGRSVAIDGGTIVVGAPLPTGTNPGPGSAYIFVQPPGGWVDMTQTAELNASNGIDYDYFGLSVAASGSTVLVGASGLESAYVFVEPAGGWANMTENAVLNASDGQANDGFGWSVALEGDTAVTGSPNNQLHGAAYVFVEPANGWSNMTETAKLKASGASDFGFSVSLVEKAIVVGAPFSNPIHEGSTYVFLKPNGGWKTTSKPSLVLSIPFNDGFDNFGTSVAVNGSTAVVGAYTAPTSPPCNPNCKAGTGEAFVFVRP
jgi:FG-GAP repeat